MCPSWARWLPCSVHSLRIVPHQHRFPRSAWDELSDALVWDEPAWCDPGDPDEWVANAVASHDADEAEHAAEHAREHYDARVGIRAERIDLRTTMCRRAELPYLVEKLDEGGRAAGRRSASAMERSGTPRTQSAGPGVPTQRRVAQVRGSSQGRRIQHPLCPGCASRM